VRASVVRGGIRALLCVPVKALDRVAGVLYADSRRPGAAFTELDVEILVALASQAGLAIAVARLGAEIKGLSERVAADAAADPGVRSQLASEISGLWERSLPAVRQPGQDTLPGAPSLTRWIAARRAALAEVDR
jgi:GAF domain-containing protein